jgi:uncharacterized SAM-binding protein YcdF (DUF218 family)
VFTRGMLPPDATSRAWRACGLKFLMLYKYLIIFIYYSCRMTLFAGFLCRGSQRRFRKEALLWRVTAFRVSHGPRGFSPYR